MAANKTKKALVPKLRFKEFDDAWNAKKLGDIGTTNGGLTYSPDNVVENELMGTLVLRSSNIQEGMMSFHDNIYVNCVITEKDFVRENDILICVRNGSKNLIGKSLIIKKEHEGFAFGAFMAIYRSNYNPFVFHFFKSRKFFKQVHEHLGATINQITSKSLNSFKLHLPTLPEQQKIAAFLSAVDEKIQQLTRKKELLEQYKKGVMQQLFPSTGSGQRSGKLRFKDSNGKAYPKWEEKRLGDVAEIIGGGTPDTLITEYWDGEIPWFTPTEISAKYVEKSKRTISKSGLKNSSAKLLPKGTILFTSRATIAELSFANLECTTNQGFQSLIVNKENNPDFIFYWIKQFKKIFIRKSQGSTFLEINKNEMQKIQMKIPTLNEQIKIGNYLSSIDSKIEFVAKQITQTQTFKKGLLQQMFV
jgi:type I restriction enzyme S subunit